MPCPPHREPGAGSLSAFMITVDSRCWGLHPKSETVDQASAAPRRLVIEQTIQL